jgi:hypothetical protein
MELSKNDKNYHCRMFPEKNVQPSPPFPEKAVQQWRRAKQEKDK